MPELWMDVDAALAAVPVNVMPLIDDTNFKSIEVAIAYNAAGMDLRWNFVTTGGTFTSTAVTPTTGGNYDWTHQGDGIYTIEMPASGGASINNDTEGFGWFSGMATGVLPWRGPVIGFRAAALNDLLIDAAYSEVRGLAGTHLDAAVSTRQAVIWATDDAAVNLSGTTIKAVTDAVTLPATATIDFTGSLSGSVGSVTGGINTSGGTHTTLDALDTALRAHGDATWSTPTGFSTLDAAGVRAAIGLGAANLDDQLSTIGTAVVVTIPAALATALAALGLITGDDGATLATSQPNFSPATAESVDELLTDNHGTGSWQTGAGSAGTGARTLTITIDDGTDPVQNARVRLSEGVSTYISLTDADGEVTFNVDDATYTVAVTKTGYTFAGASLVVSASASQTYSMTAIVVPPAVTDDRATGSLRVYDEEGEPESGASVSVQIQQGPGTAGHGYDTTVWTETSDANGDVHFAGLVRGATYIIYRGTSSRRGKTFVVPDADTFDIDELLGSP